MELLNFLADDDVIEISCTIENGEVKPIKMENVPEMQQNLIKAVKFLCKFNC